MAIDKKRIRRMRDGQLMEVVKKSSRFSGAERKLAVEEIERRRLTLPVESRFPSDTYGEKGDSQGKKNSEVQNKETTNSPKPGQFGFYTRLILILPLTFISFIFGLSIMPLMHTLTNVANPMEYMLRYNAEELIGVALSLTLLSLFFFNTRRRGTSELLIISLLIGIVLAYNALFVWRL